MKCKGKRDGGCPFTETRSFNMSQIKGKNTKPEELVRRYLFSHGFRYRKNVSTLPGKPDIVLPKYKTCIFVMDASGISMRAAGISSGRRTMQSSGRKRSLEMLNVICANKTSCGYLAGT